MQRHFLRLRAFPVVASRGHQAIRVRGAGTPAFASTTSAPPEAQGPSAESGGSRSKDAESTSTSAVPDGLADGSAKGRTGGGEPLESSENAPPQPKILNAKVAGHGQKLTEEQKREVDEHNRDFDEKHDRASAAADDKVDKNFWKQ